MGVSTSRCSRGLVSPFLRQRLNVLLQPQAAALTASAARTGGQAGGRAPPGKDSAGPTSAPIAAATSSALDGRARLRAMAGNGGQADGGVDVLRLDVLRRWAGVRDRACGRRGKRHPQGEMESASDYEAGPAKNRRCAACGCAPVTRPQQSRKVQASEGNAPSPLGFSPSSSARARGRVWFAEATAGQRRPLRPLTPRRPSGLP